MHGIAFLAGAAAKFFQFSRSNTLGSVFRNENRAHKCVYLKIYVYQPKGITRTTRDNARIHAGERLNNGGDANGGEICTVVRHGDSLAYLVVHFTYFQFMPLSGRELLSSINCSS